MKKDLEGKTALVTGGGRGIGRGISIRLAAAGALVAVNYARDKSAAEATVADIEAKGGKAFLVQAELGTPGAQEALIGGLDMGFYPRSGATGLDILINNIGGTIAGTVETAKPDDFDWVMNLNLRAPFFLTQALMPRLRNGGRVINISSATTRVKTGDHAVYTMAKVGLEALTVMLAKSLGGRGITVNSVGPGYTETPSTSSVLKDAKVAKMIADSTLIKRIAQPEDIADFVHALCSPAGRWITGQCIEASGGMRL